MGVGRLLAKGWIVFCVFGAVHAVAGDLQRGVPTGSALQMTVIAALLFGAMGLLFVAGYGLSSGHLLARFRPTSFVPGFNELVMLAFLGLSLWFQIASVEASSLSRALESAIRFAVPGQRALEGALVQCGAGGRGALCSAVAWLLAFIFLGSALSRLRITAALVRLERRRRIEPLGPAGVALVLGFAAVLGLQMLFLGTLYPLLGCGVWLGLFGKVLIGAGPLMLSYLAAVALVNLLALGPDS